MPIDDSGSNLASAPAVFLPKKKPVTFAAPGASAAAPAAPAAAAPAPLETPEQQAARAQRNQLISTGNNGGYIAPGAKPEKATPDAVAAAFPGTKPSDSDYWLKEQQVTDTYQRRADVASGNNQPGSYAGLNDSPDAIHPYLSKDEGAGQRIRDFGLGSNNNAQTAAMLAQSQATGDKYSSAFDASAGAAGANSAAAGARGLAGYGGNTDQYTEGLSNAQQSRGMQTQAYQALMGVKPQTDAYDALMQFANGQQGPSAAQAQLNQATDANMQNTLALARSGRGMGGSQAALRQAIGQNAGIQQQSANQAAALRAQEYQAYQQNKLGALGSAGGLSSQADQTRLSAINAAGGVAGQTVGADQAYGQLGLAGAQYQTDTALKGTQLNDASAQAWAAQQQQAYNQAMGADMGAQTQGLNINATALAGRENEYASANQTYAAEKGFAQQAAIADANRQDAYTAAAFNAAGTIAGSLSDERAKTNFKLLGEYRPLKLFDADLGDDDQDPELGSFDASPKAKTQAPGAALSGNDVKPLSSGSGGTVTSGPTVKMGPTEAEREEASKKSRDVAIGSGTGKAVGGIVGSYFGPLGTAAGVAAGGYAGKALGKMFSDVRLKENIQPMSDKYVEPRVAPGGGLSANGDYLRGNFAAGKRELDRDAFGDLEALAQKYGASGVADSPKAVAKYSNERPNAKALQRFAKDDHPILSEGDALLAGVPLEMGAGRNRPSAAARFARDDSHPILSEGDALLADSARAAPPSAYDYKDPTEPGAKPGRQVGPMAQDLAAHPVTRGIVDADPATGKLRVDGARAATVGLAQNHAQQNHIDALSARLNELEDLLPESLRRKKGDERATSFSTSTGGL